MSTEVGKVSKDEQVLVKLEAEADVEVEQNQETKTRKTPRKTIAVVLLALALVILVTTLVTTSGSDSSSGYHRGHRGHDRGDRRDRWRERRERLIKKTFKGLPEAVSFDREMIVTSTPLATAAGQKVLEAGGTAADAMVAAQTVLSLVEPQSCGIGGGAFVVYYEKSTGTLTTIDSREKAPSAATEDRFAGLSFTDAWQSGLSVGVPGVVKMMEHVQSRFGNKDWSSGELFESAINLARNGYNLTDRSSSQVASLIGRNAGCADEERTFFRDSNAFDMFVNYERNETTGEILNCQAKAEGDFMLNDEYATTLEAIRDNGSNAFYFGEIAEAIAASVQNDPRIGGDMTVEDLANYNIVERDSVCQFYRGYEVCGMGPPSSGALAVGQILGIMENWSAKWRGSKDFPYPLNERDIHLYSQAMRLAFADRNKYVGDTDFVDVPIEGMLNKTYLKERSELITAEDMGIAAAGVPPGAEDLDYAQIHKAKNTGTAHVSIVDRYGNALSMTTTIESSFGNGVMVKGFMLNNELTDFNFEPTDSDGTPAANRVQANKRPRSSMSPSIIFKNWKGQRKLTHVTGSPGGSRIISYTAQSIINMLDYGLNPQQAINVPHYMNRNGATTDLEPTIDGVLLDWNTTLMTEKLEARGHSVSVTAQTSGLSVIKVERNRKGKKYVGGGDLRRGGTVGGSNF